MPVTVNSFPKVTVAGIVPLPGVVIILATLLLSTRYLLSSFVNCSPLLLKSALLVMIIDVRPVQPLKALAPTLVTLAGMFIVERVVQSLNASAAMPVIEKLLPLVTDVAIVTLFAHELAATITLYLLSTAYRMPSLVKHSPLLLKSTVSLFTVTDVKRVQFAKASSQTLVIFWGITIDVRLLQP